MDTIIRLFFAIIIVALVFSCTPEQSLLNHQANKLPVIKLPVIYSLKTGIQPGYAPPPNYNEIEYLLEVALGSEYGVGDYAVRKWTTDLEIELIGHPTAQDLQTVNEVIADLNELIGTQIRVRIVPANGNVQMYFIPEAEFYRYEPPGIVYYGGFFWNWWNFTGEIYRARVVIAADRVSQKHRSHLIREELTQILGLMNDSMRHKDSIFYQQHSLTDKFSPIDRSLIKMLYDKEILPGMTDFEIRELFFRSNRRHRN
jgi:hypothetical protein